MADPRIAEIDKLYQEVLFYKDPTSFKDLLQFVSKFRKFAPYNAMLIHMQKPGSKYVASAWEWREKFGRTVKPGARPLLILQPFGPVAFVFEYGDTEGLPLPDEMVKPFKVASSALDLDMYDKLCHAIKFEGIRLYHNDLGTNLAGSIHKAEETAITIDTVTVRYIIRSNYAVVIANHLNVSEKFATLLHELAHFFCGHLNCGARKKHPYLPNRIMLSLPVREFEAETVCWLICERMGIDNPSKEYLSGYLDRNEKRIPDVSVDAILKAAGQIEKLIFETPRPRKELLKGTFKLTTPHKSGQSTLF